MARQWVGQTAFSSGVLDARLKGRYDLEMWFRGMAVGRNIICLPQGGFKRRGGFRYHATLTSEARLVEFEFNTEQTYALAFQDSRIDIFRDGSLVHSITSSVPWLEADLFELDVAQSGDTMIIVHEDHQPRTLVRGSSDTDWTLTAITFTNIPQYDFNDASSPTPVSEVQDIVFESAALNGDTYKLELEGIETDTITYSSSTGDNETRIAEALQDLINTGDSGISVAYQSGTTYRVTFATDSAKDWELMSGRIITAADVGDNVKILVNASSDGTARTEDTWSSTRGWPRTVTFHEGRLWFGGSRDRPATIWASRTFRFFDFKLAKARDDDAIEYVMGTDQLNVIQWLKSGRRLQIGTSGAEFIVDQIGITPENMGVLLQTGYGSKRVSAVIIDGATVFSQRTGKTVRELLFAESEGAYTGDALNIRAPSLVNGPVQLAAWLGSSSEEANYLFVVNNDGTVAVMNTLRAESVAAWTLFTTQGNIKSIAVADQRVYLSVERTINGSTVYTLEELDDDYRLDASVLATQAASTTVTGLSHLNGEVCRIRDGNTLLSDVTPSGGSVTAESAVTNPEVGLGWARTEDEGWEWRVETMPVGVLKGFQPAANKSLIRTTIDLINTLGLYVQDEYLENENDGLTLDADNVLFTGQWEKYHFGWYQGDLSVFLGQKDPLPALVLGIEIEVGQ